MRKRALFTILIVLLGQSVLLFQSGTGQSNVIPDHFLDDSYDLQAMIDSTPEGGALYLPEGEFRGIYYVNRSIDIIGQGNDTTILSSSYNTIQIQSSGVNISDIGFRSGSSCIYIRGNYNNIGIYGCNFSNCYRGISIYNSYSHSEDMIIRNNSFYNAINDGVYIQGVRYCEIDHNSFHHVGDGIYANEMEYSNISRNIFENGEMGINLRNSDMIVVTSNAAKGFEVGIGVSYTTGTNISNSIVSNSMVGIKIERSTGIVTERNQLKDLEKGIYLFYSDENRIHNNTVERSTGNGIEVYFSRYNSIENCSVSDCATNFEGLVIAGIYVGYASYYNTVKDNEMTGCGMSIYPFTSTWEGQEVFDNTVNGRDLVFIKYESDILIDENAGQVLLYKCSNVTISGQDLSNATFGLFAVDCDEIHIDECQLDDNHYGIDFLSDENYDTISDISIINCSIERTLFSILIESDYWIRDVKIAYNTLSEGRTALNINSYYSSSSSSTGIDISNNTISGFEYYGITLYGLREVDIMRNRFDNCNNSLKVIGNYYDDNYWNDISHNIVERGERGFNLSSINDLTLKENIISNTTDFGMTFSAMKDAEITGNSIVPSGGTGIIFSGYSSDNQVIKDNIIHDAETYGILMKGASNLEFKDNELNNCGFFIDPNGGGNWNDIDLDDSNKVNGRPVLFAAHQHSISVPEDPGQIIVKECDTVYLQDLSIENTTVAVQLVNCDNYKIDNCSFDDNYIGVYIQAIHDDWRGGRITSSIVKRCMYDGISVTQSQLLMENCTIQDCGYPYSENGRSGIYSVHEDLYLRETEFIRCGVFFDLESIEDIRNDLVSENTTVNGKDLIVMVSKDEIAIEQGAGQIYLINCFDVKIMDQDLSRSTIGIYSISSWNINIENVSTNQCLYGIHIICYESQPTGFDMENSTFNNCRYEGVKIRASDPYFVDNIRFFGIECSGNGGNGLTINRVRNGFSMENSTLSGNGKTGLDLIQFQGWEYKIKIANCTLDENGMSGAAITVNSRSFIYGNGLRNNGKYGMKIRDSNYPMEIVKNDMSSNGMSGLIMDDYFSNFVIDNNTFSSNSVFGIDVKGSTHLITYNDIIGNGEDGVWMQSSQDRGKME